MLLYLSRVPYLGLSLMKIFFLFEETRVENKLVPFYRFDSYLHVLLAVIGCDWKCRTSVLRCNFRTSVESFSKWMKLLFRLINVVHLH